MIHAYDRDYVESAQRILGDAVDFAVMTLDVEPDIFGNSLAVSKAGAQFCTGNPKYVAGMNGCEFARAVLEETKVPFKNSEDVMYTDKSPEFWAGWALAFYQWHSDRSFGEILGTVPLSHIIDMYPVYHEMDVMQFADSIYAQLKEKNPQTKLRAKRENIHISQSELAAETGVPLRQIQLFEQRQRDINKTSADTLKRLSKALHCRMEDLMEREG